MAVEAIKKAGHKVIEWDQIDEQFASEDDTLSNMFIDHVY